MIEVRENAQNMNAFSHFPFRIPSRKSADSVDEKRAHFVHMHPAQRNPTVRTKTAFPFLIYPHPKPLRKNLQEMPLHQSKQKFQSWTMWVSTKPICLMNALTDKHQTPNAHTSPDLQMNCHK
jgi:hypothetical protein